MGGQCALAGFTREQAATPPFKGAIEKEVRGAQVGKRRTDSKTPYDGERRHIVLNEQRRQQKNIKGKIEKRKKR